MTKFKNLRPNLPDELNEEMQSLIRECWDPEPALRPSFSVCLFRLRSIIEHKISRQSREASQGDGLETEALKHLMRTKEEKTVEEEVLMLW